MFVHVPDCCIAPCVLVLQTVPRYNIEMNQRPLLLLLVLSLQHVPHVAVDKNESPFQSYKSKRILSFANLTCSSVSGPEALKKARLRFAILSYSAVKSYGKFSK